MGCAVGQAIGQYGNRVMIRVRDPWDRSSSHYPLGMGTCTRDPRPGIWSSISGLRPWRN